MTTEKAVKAKNQEPETIDVYIMGKRYKIPKGLTIMQALEYAGYQIKRGAGCRAGFCGACGTVYQIKGEPQLKFDLACQTEAQQDMYLTQIPLSSTCSMNRLCSVRPAMNSAQLICPAAPKTSWQNSALNSSSRDVFSISF